ncbi:MAG: hypothetical protein HKN71_07895, partial [Gemmatimonadetes bacterium]|nr:hypothetical protein [Gemmatimonadota bacterium]
MDHPEDASTSPPRGPVRAAARGAAVGFAGIVGVVVVGVILLQFDAVGTSVVRALGARFAPPGLSLEVERVSGNWLSSLEVIDARLVDSAGAPALALDSLRVEWYLPALLSRRFALERVEAAGVEVHLARDSVGVVGLRGGTAPTPSGSTGAPASAPTDTTASSWTVSVDSAHITRLSGDLGAIGAQPPTLVWDEGAGQITDLRLGPAPAATVASFTIRAEAPSVASVDAVGPLQMTGAGSLAEGRLRIDTLVAVGKELGLWAAGDVSLPAADGAPGPLSLNLVAEGFPLALLHGLLGRAPDETARVDGAVVLSGTTRSPSADVDLRLRNGGRVSGSAAGTLGEGPTRVVAQLVVESLDPGRILADSAWSGRVDGRVDVELEGPGRSRLDGRADLEITSLDVAALPLDRVDVESVWTSGEAALDLRIRADVGTVALSGTARPLDSVPTYDLGGDVNLALEADSMPPIAGAGRLRIAGSGVTLDQARADATLRLSSLSVGDARLDTADARVALAEGTARWRLAGRDAATGRIQAAGTARPGPPATVRVDSATVIDLDLADLLGEPEGSRFDARGSGSVTLGDPRSAEARFDVTVRQARWGTIRFDTAVAVGRLAGGVVRTDLRVRSSVGRLAGALSAEPFESSPGVDVDSLIFADLDLGALARVAGDSAAAAFSTRLNGRIAGRVEGASADDAMAALDLQLGPSTVNRQSLMGGEGRVRIDDGLVTADLDLGLPESGRIALTARVRPFLDRPVVDIDALDFEGLDPFALAAPTPAPMDARMAGRLTGRIEGADPASLDGELVLELDASRLNRASISGGRFDASMQGGRWDARGDVRLADGRLTLDANADIATDTATWALDLAVQSESPGRLLGARVEDGWVDATLHAEGRGLAPATLEARFDARADSASFGDVRVDTLRLSGGLADGFAQFDTLTLRSNVADATGGGSIAYAASADRVSDLSVDVTLRSINALEAWVGIEPLGLGEGRITASVAGPPDAMRWTTSARASALLLGRTELLGLEADATGSLDPGLVLAGFDGDLQLDRLTAFGVDVEVSRVAAQFDGGEWTVEGDATVDDRRDVSFALRADPRGERPAATLERFDLRVDADRWALAGSPTIGWGEGLEFDSLTLRSGTQAISLDGRFDPSGTSDLSARIDQLRLG